MHWNLLLFKRFPENLNTTTNHPVYIYAFSANCIQGRYLWARYFYCYRSESTWKYTYTNTNKKFLYLFPSQFREKSQSMFHFQIVSGVQICLLYDREDDNENWFCVFKLNTRKRREVWFFISLDTWWKTRLAVTLNKESLLFLTITSWDMNSVTCDLTRLPHEKCITNVMKVTNVGQLK